MSKITRITKSYSRKVSLDYQVWGFQTSLEAEVEVNSAEDLIKESDKLQAQAKGLVNRDIKKTKDLVESAKKNSGIDIVEEK